MSEGPFVDTLLGLVFMRPCIICIFSCRHHLSILLFCHLFVYSFIYLLVWAWPQRLHDKEPSSLDDSKAKADWHVVTPDVRGCGPKSPGAISRSQLPTGMSKTVHQSVEFVFSLCSLHRDKLGKKGGKQSQKRTFLNTVWLCGS